jgi:hypothetical protein
VESPQQSADLRGKGFLDSAVAWVVITKNLRRWAYVIVFFAVTADFVKAGDAVPSWKAFERELSSAKGDGPPFWGACDASPTFNNLVSNRDEAAFVEMTAQEDSFFVKLAGFYGLGKLDEKKALECGLKIALSASPTNPALPCLLYNLSEMHLTNGYNEALSEVFRATAVGASAYFTIKMLPFDRLFDWFQWEDRGWTVPSYEAIVLSRLWNDMRRAGKPPTDKMRTTLAEYAAIPGIPRKVYLDWADESGPEYKAVMKYALEDDSLSDAEFNDLLMFKGAYIVRNVKLDELNVSDERRKSIQNALAQFKH